jgi:hypothetical protein
LNGQLKNKNYEIKRLKKIMVIEKTLIKGNYSADFYTKEMELIVGAKFVNFTIESKLLPAYELTFHSLFANYANGEKVYISHIK